MVKYVVFKFKSVVLCFQESKVETVSRSFLRSFTGAYFDKCHFVKSERASGGIITCWSSRVFACSEVIVRNFSITVCLKFLSSSTSFYVTNVYGPPTWEGKDDFCKELGDLKSVCRGRWVICGDFNLTRNHQERRGRGWSRRLIGMFNELINDLQVIDLPMGNQNFMWSNMLRCPTLARLDRFLVSTEWDLTFPLSKVVAASRITSDHFPILLHTGEKLSKHLFRVEEMWFAQEDFCALLPQWRNETSRKENSVLTFTAKIKHCRKRMKEWCHTSFYSVANTKKVIVDEIQQLDILEESQNPTLQQFELRSQLKTQLSGIVTDEETMWKARSRQYWLKRVTGTQNFFTQWRTLEDGPTQLT